MKLETNVETTYPIEGFNRGYPIFYDDVNEKWCYSHTGEEIDSYETVPCSKEGVNEVTNEEEYVQLKVKLSDETIQDLMVIADSYGVSFQEAIRMMLRQATQEELGE